MRTPIRPNVLQMRPYSPGKPIEEVKRELGIERVVKLASNENPLGPSPMAIEAVRTAAPAMHLYPDGGAYDVRQALARKFAVEPKNIMLGNGSDELLHLLGLIFLGSPEDEVIVGDPSFVRYDAAAYLAPSALVKVPLDRNFVHDLPAMARAVTPKTKLVFIANPNNPTGTIVQRSDLEKFLDDLPDHVTTVIDEAYFEFAATLPVYPNSLDYVRQEKNVIGLRTFSKTYGLAGIRIGYGFAHEEVVDALERAREPFDVNSLAQVAAVAALEDDEHVRKTLENNRRGMVQIAGVLRAVGAKVCDSYANFVFAELGRPARPVFEAMLRRGVIIRSGEGMGSPTCIRVSIGTEEEVDLFVQAFAEVADELGLCS